MKLGVLALQGAVSEHLDVLNDLGVEGLAVRYAEELEDLDGLILPGGESTTLEKLMRRFGLDVALRQALERGMACWGTCAGMILLSQEIANAINGQTGLGHLPVKVVRNCFGRQVDSCETPLEIKGLQGEAFPAVFIRAPGVSDILDPQIEVLAHHQDMIVAVRYGRVLATSFHPELTGDHRLHKFFIEQVVGCKLVER